MIIFMIFSIKLCIWNIFYFVVLSKQIICISYKMNEKKNNIYTRKKINNNYNNKSPETYKATAFQLTYQSHSTEK